MDEQAKTTIERLELFKEKLAESERSLTPALRTYLNMHKQWVRQQVLEAGCFVTVTISPPPAVGGLLMQNIDPFTMMFHPPYVPSTLRS